MLDALKSLFSSNSTSAVTSILTAVAQLVAFLEQQFQSDPTKVNEAIDHIKSVLDSHKK